MSSAKRRSSVKVLSQVALAKAAAARSGHLNCMKSPLDRSVFAPLQGKAMRVLHLIECPFPVEDFQTLSKNDLRFLTHFVNSSVGRSGKEVAAILRLLPPNMNTVDFGSNKIAINEVDEVIAALPPNIRLLRVSGNEFGELGMAKFTAYRDRVEKETGFRMVLD